MRLLLGALDTAGAVTVVEQRLDGPGGPPLHTHPGADEIIMVLEGGPLTLIVGDQKLEVAAGGFTWIPRGTPHAFSNLSGAPLKMLGIASPGGIEQPLHDQAMYMNALSGPPDIERIAEIWEHHGKIVGPPIM